MDDKFKDLFSKIKGTASAAADVAEAAAKQVGQKTGETLEVAKFNIKINELNNEIGTCQRDIGKIMYDAHLGKETNEEELVALFASIDEKLEEIENYKAKIADIKKGTICPACGEPCGKADIFCKKCGSTIQR